MDQKYHIAFATDKDFQIPLALALYSLQRTQQHPEQFCVHILHGGIDRSIFEPLKLDLHFYKVENQLKELPAGGRFPTPIYYRFLLPDILPTSISKVLYLDCDIMVMRDITELWDIELDGSVMAACPWLIFGDYQEEYLPYVEQFPARLGVDAPKKESRQHYFYSSFLMMDLSIMRDESVSAQLVRASQQIPAEKLLWPDQDVLNYVLMGRIASLPLSCNVIPLFARSIEQENQQAQQAYGDPLIIHFAATKPNILTGEKLPFERDFFRLWKSSPWASLIPYPLVSLRALPKLLRRLIELPIKLSIKRERLLRLYGRFLSMLRPRG